MTAAFASFWAQAADYREQGRGIACFGASPALVKQFVALGRETAAIQHIPLSQWRPERPLDPATLLIIEQDLPYPAFAERLETVVDKLIFPLWYARRGFCFFSCLPEEEYRRKELSPTAVHDDFPGVVRFLLQEQLLNLLTDALVWVNGEATAVPPPQPRLLYQPLPQSYPLDPDLDPDQRKAQEHLRGPIRVLAPAGSGKTKTLTNRIVHLLNQGVPGEQILALAFNKKAADEMNERLRHKGVSHVQVRTFHALGYHILRETLGWRYDGDEAHEKLRQLLRQAVNAHVQLNPKRGGDPLEPFLEALRRVKTELLPLADFAVQIEEIPIPFAPIFETFLRLQARQKLLTFDDMIYLAARLLLKDDALRRRYQQQHSYLLVDEFQDLNQSQLLMLQILSLPENNVFVVGDDDQMIYGWRGADVRHIMDFTNRFPMAVDTVLETNYRSSRSVVVHSRRLIEHNQARVHKAIRPRADAQPGLLTVRAGADLWDQANLTAAWIQEMRGEQADWPAFAILYRYRAYQYPLALALDKQDVPHTAVDLGRLFFTPVGRDLFAYMSLIFDPATAAPEQIARVLKRPNKYLTNQLIAAVNNWSRLESVAAFADMADWQLEKLERFVDDLRQLQGQVQTGRPSATSLMFQIDLAFGLQAFYRNDARPSADLDEESDAILFETLLPSPLISPWRPIFTPTPGGPRRGGGNGDGRRPKRSRGWPSAPFTRPKGRSGPTSSISTSVRGDTALTRSIWRRSGGWLMWPPRGPGIICW
jgi:superfamily I DNA/RNA helicase